MERGLPGWFMRLKYSDKNWSLSNAVLRRDEALMVRRAITHHVPMNRKNHSRYRKKKPDQYRTFISYCGSEIKEKCRKIAITNQVCRAPHISRALSYELIKHVVALLRQRMFSGTSVSTASFHWRMECYGGGAPNPQEHTSLHANQ